MEKLYEYILLTKKPRMQVVGFFYCQKHWDASGKREFDADPGDKKLNELSVENAADHCHDCREERG